MMMMRWILRKDRMDHFGDRSRTPVKATVFQGDGKDSLSTNQPARLSKDYTCSHSNITTYKPVCKYSVDCVMA
jgi:hypothetical protein